MIWFTSDMHLNHWTDEKRNIIRYCNRPFRDVHHMNSSLIRNWNSRVQPTDTVYHLGDFCFSTGGLKMKPHEWEEELMGKVVHIVGNHDTKNSMKGALSSGLIQFGGLKTYIVHEPPKSIYDLPSKVDLILCGHVHQAWVGRLYNGVIPMLNVGVDVRRYAPMNIPEVTRAAGQLRNGVKGNERRKKKEESDG